VRSVVVVGAGTFGASLAWWLARSGWAVTLVDQFVPGDPRASSGGESRLIRCAHGSDADYTASARRARELWREVEAETREELLVECGLAWFAHREGGWESASRVVLDELGVPVERLEPSAAARLFPALGTRDLAFVLWEPEAGVLRAQRAVRALVAAAVAHGARVERGRARPEADRVRLEDARALEADVVVWACGGWLGTLFADLVSVRSTRQDLFFLAGGPAWRTPRTPGWVDYDRALYGTGDLDGLGVKAAPDAEGPPLAPDAELPEVDPAGERRVREYLATRFPPLAAAPLVGARTCRYELTADSHFLAGPHPEHPSVWLVGGGSGHGFKHGPAVAERLAPALAGEATAPARWGLHHRSPARSLRTAGSSPWASAAPARSRPRASPRG
jgi:glycine/D-amino acid oxidase-like deaminating enzyme